MEWWEFVLVLAITLPIMVLWLGCIIDVISRPDLGGFTKAAWTLFILFLPLIGSLTYIIVRPRSLTASSNTFDEVWGNEPDTVPSTAATASTEGTHPSI